MRRIYFVVLFCLIFGEALAEEITSPLPVPEKKQYNLLTLSHAYSHGYFRFVPVPVFETNPASGQRYGLMPTFLWFDHDDNLITILVTAVTYNPQVVHWGGYGGLFIYPSVDESLQIYFQASENYERDFSVTYDNASFLDGPLDVGTSVGYIRNPFERFFGFGPNSSQSNESNFVSGVASWNGRVAYSLIPSLHVQLEESWQKATIQDKALPNLPDTLLAFGSLPEVKNSNQWSHTASLIWDSRDNKNMPSTGAYLKPYLLASHEPFSDQTFYGGYGLITKKFVTWYSRFTTVVAFKLEQLFGNTVPLYAQPYLGGGFDLRGFMTRRFTGRSRILLDLEERVVVKHCNFFDVKFDFTIDPFFSVGQVFDHWSEVKSQNLRPVAGVGFRAKVPTSVVGRVDVGFGGDGPVVFTTLNYPF